MSKLYFEKFPKIAFDTFGVVDIATFLPSFPVKSKTTDFSITLSNIFLRARIIPKLLNDTAVYYPYVWKNADRPDTVASKYYGDEKFFWLVFFSNGAFDLKMDFPLPPQHFKAYLVEKYKDDPIILASIPAQDQHLLQDPERIELLLNSVPHHTETSSGIIVDSDYVGGASVSYYDFELRENEKNRTIKLVARSFASQIDYELRKLLSDL